MSIFQDGVLEEVIWNDDHPDLRTLLCKTFTFDTTKNMWYRVLKSMTRTIWSEALCWNSTPDDGVARIWILNVGVQRDESSSIELANNTGELHIS
jgi:hypothetical protein